MATRTMPKRPPKPDSTVLSVSRPQAVRLLDVSDRTYARLEAEGVIVALRPGAGRRASSYNAFTIVRSYMAHRELKLTGSRESSRDRRDRSQAELNELRLARERRALLPREQVVLEGRAFVKALMAKLDGVGARLVRAGVISAEAAPSVMKIVNEVRGEIARWQTHVDLLAAVDEVPTA